MIAKILKKFFGDPVPTTPTPSRNTFIDDDSSGILMASIDRDNFLPLKGCNPCESLHSHPPYYCHKCGRQINKKME